MKKIIIIILTVLLVSLIAGFIWYMWGTPEEQEKGEVPVGILHSITGTLAISEQPVVDATLLAIQEINDAGGVLGKTIKPIVVDGKSDWPTFAEQAEYLITKKKVPVVFGCWTSASRKAVKPVFEKFDHLLFYPVQYEGLEESKHIVYTGATINQQVIPGVVWSFENLGKRFFLVGSDYIFPRTANAVIKEVVRSLGGTIVGEEYILLGSNQVDPLIKRIVQTNPTVIINTINGDTNIPFFRKLRKAGISPGKIPTMSFSMAEPELKRLDIDLIKGDYAAWSYFQSIDSLVNDHFLKKMKELHGQDVVVSDPMEAAYFGVHVWAQAVQEAQTFDPELVIEKLKFQSYNAPEGIVSIDAQNLHTWKRVRIGKIESSGQFNIVWDSHKAVKPQPFPTEFKSKSTWREFIMKLYDGWGKSWAAS